MYNTVIKKGTKVQYLFKSVSGEDLSPHMNQINATEHTN